MLTFQRFILTFILILIGPILFAQDITGDWYGRYQAPDSMHINIHISKDKKGLKATWDSPDKDLFNIPVPVIHFEKDELVFEIHARYISYVGQVNEDYSFIKGHMWTGDLIGLDFGRKRLLRTNQVKDSALVVLPAKTEVIRAGNPREIAYSGIRVIKEVVPKVVETDTSKLKKLTPGNDTLSHPIIYRFPDAVTRSEYPFKEGNSQSAPIIAPAIQTEPVTANPMRMKDAACFNIQYLDVEQGLPDPDIRSILEDSKGNIWFGTNSAGICRYDGKSFNFFTEKEGLPGLGNRAMLEDRLGNIWIGTNLGVCKYDGNSFIHYSGGAIHSILSIVESEDGCIWFGTNNGAIVKKGNFWTHYRKNEGLTGNSVNVILEDNNGDIWMGTEKGLCRFNGVSFTHFTKKDGLTSNIVRSGIKDRNGNLWFGTDRGVCKYNGKYFSWITAASGLSGNYISTIAEDYRGNLWFGTDGGGVIMFDGNNFTHFTTREGLVSDHITSIIEDKSNNLWLGTADGGAMRVQRNSFNYFVEFEKINQGQVMSITEDHRGNIWFGMYGQGLLTYNGESFQILTADKGLNDNYIRSVMEDRSGTIWFINNHGLHNYDGKGIIRYYDAEGAGSSNGNQYECIMEDDAGNIWMGTREEGLIRFNGNSFTHFHRMTPGHITSALPGSKGEVWYGTATSGAQKFDGKCITKYNINEGLSGLEVTALYEDDKGNLWIGLNEGGINKFDGQTMACYTEEDGLISNNARSIIGDNNGNIWVGTTGGLSLLSPQENGDYSILSFGTEDGLKDISFNKNAAFLDRRNRLWWGTGNTVTMLDLNQFEMIPAEPVIQLNNIYLNQEYIDFRTLFSGVSGTKNSPSGKTRFRGFEFNDVAPFRNYPVDLELPHHMNHVSFHFAATEWSAPQSIKYQYKLEGFDKQWNVLTKDNIADYRNIPPGEYIFRVKALSRTHAWSETLEYPFTIRRPWWFRWWAFTVYAILLVLVSRYFIRYIIGRERIKAEIQIKQVEVDKMQELDRMKSRFFANISHEFRTPLTLLLGPVEDLLKKGKGDIKMGRDLLEIMQRNGRKLMRLINQLLDISKLESGGAGLRVSSGNAEQYVRTIFLSFLSHAESKKIKFEYDLPETDHIVYFDSDKLEKILDNLVSNAFKFTPADGEIKVSFRYILSREPDAMQNMEIKVSDTGRGIPDEKLDSIFDRFYQVGDPNVIEEVGTGIGLALTRELVQLYHGEIHVESEVGKGSTFTVRLPCLKEQFRKEEITETTMDEEEKAGYVDPNITIKEGEPAETDCRDDLEKSDDEYSILVVEDNMDLRKYISGILGSNHRVMAAENGEMGLEIAFKDIPDLVISDVMMPGMDGIEFCYQLKKDERTNHIPVILLTARADRGSKLEGLETGADDYIIKPFDAEELKVRVRNLIEQRKKLRNKIREVFVTETEDKEFPYEDQFTNKLSGILDKYLSDAGFSIDHLAGELHMSRAQVFRKINAITGYTPNDLIRNHRLKKAASLFRSGHSHITQVMHRVGFNSPSWFSKCFHELYGITPSEYIKQKKS